MEWFAVAVIVLIVAAVLWGAIKMARAFQREIDAAKKKAAKDRKKQSPYHWVWNSFHSIWFAALPAVKYAYRAWRAAPPGSLAKFGWTMAFAAVVAVALWAIVKILDTLVNRETKPAIQPDGMLAR